MSEKNELKASGLFGFGDESLCLEIQSAYSITNNLGIMGNFMYAWGGDMSEKDYGNGFYIDGAMGYFKPLSENWIFEIYGGMGISSQKHEYTTLQYNSGSFFDQYNGNSNLTFSNFFVQPSLGVKVKFLEAAVSARTCIISYLKVDNNIFGDAYYLIDEVNKIAEKSHYFLEPAFTLRLGFKNIKLQTQISYILNLNNPRLYFGEELHLSLGVIFNIPLNSRELLYKE